MMIPVTQVEYGQPAEFGSGTFLYVPSDDGSFPAIRVDHEEKKFLWWLKGLPWHAENTEWLLTEVFADMSCAAIGLIRVDVEVDRCLDANNVADNLGHMVLARVGAIAIAKYDRHQSLKHFSKTWIDTSNWSVAGEHSLYGAMDFPSWRLVRERDQESETLFEVV